MYKTLNINTLNMDQNNDERLAYNSYQ